MSPTVKVLISAPYLLPELDRFRPILERAGMELVVSEVEERLEEDELLEFAGEIDGVICGDDRFTRRVQEAYAPRLRAISKWGTGIDSIDGEAAKALGIVVGNTPGAFTEPVSDTVLGYVLAFARRQPWLDREMKEGGWVKRAGRALHECTLGVVGVGRIGRATLRKASSFQMKLLGNDIVEVASSFLEEVPVAMVDLQGLLAHSDYVSLNCDLNPTSHHLIGVEELSAMRSSAVLINTARGPVVDEPALVESLRNGELAGAALDVFEKEPLPVESPLRQMDNVLLAPHNANASLEAWERVHRNTIRNLFEGLGLPPPDDLDAI